MEDRIISTSYEDRDMSATLPDGTKVPIKGKVVRVTWASGKVDTRVEMDRPFPLFGQNPAPGLEQK